MKRLAIFCLVLGLQLGCANNAPPNVTPQATAAWYGTQAIKDLDIVRDVAISANSVVPPVISTDTTRKIVLWHESAIKVIHNAPNGWKTVILASITEVEKDLPAGEQMVLNPYFEAAKAAINLVVQ